MTEQHECEHKNIVINPSLTTNVMAITLNIFGFKCEDCEKQWDIGNAVDAIQATERYQELIMAVGNKHDGETRHETALRYILEAERGSDIAYANILEDKDTK